jgi:hypothetical protein
MGLKDEGKKNTKANFSYLMRYHSLRYEGIRCGIVCLFFFVCVMETVIFFGIHGVGHFIG